MIRFILGTTAVIMLFIALAAPSEKDIKACTESTGWTKERCQMEITR